MSSEREVFLHVRCSPALKDKAKEAARICGESLTEFVGRAVALAIEEASPKRWLVYRCKNKERTAWRIVKGRDFEEARATAGSLRGAHGWRLELVPQSDAYEEDWGAMGEFGRSKTR